LRRETRHELAHEHTHEHTMSGDMPGLMQFRTVTLERFTLYMRFRVQGLANDAALQQAMGWLTRGYGMALTVTNRWSRIYAGASRRRSLAEGKGCSVEEALTVTNRWIYAGASRRRSLAEGKGCSVEEVRGCYGAEVYVCVYLVCIDVYMLSTAHPLLTVTCAGG